MTLRIVSVVCLLLATGCRPSSSAELTEDRAAAIQDSVRAFLATWSEGVPDGDWETMLERYVEHPNFVWVEDGQIRYRSVQAVGEAVGALEARFTGSSTEFVEPSITPLAPGLAHVATRFRTTLRREEGPDVAYGGAMTMTIVHAADGWKVLHGHTSSSRPGEGR